MKNEIYAAMLIAAACIAYVLVLKLAVIYEKHKQEITNNMVKIANNHLAGKCEHCSYYPAECIKNKKPICEYISKQDIMEESK